MPIPSKIKKLVRSLQIKKYRQEEQCFIVQGAKAVKETLSSDFHIRTTLATSKFIGTLSQAHAARAGEIVVVSEEELQATGSVEANNAALAVVDMKQNKRPVFPSDDYTLLLDDIRDPGNLGTIIRAADWYGIRNVVASPETTDWYSPKVINATMGSFLRVNVYYASLEEILCSVSLPVYGAFLDGENIHKTRFGKAGMVVIGSESRGISPAVEKRIKYRVTIPRVGHAESLNAAVAAAVILDNIRRS